jgi:tight adherence protein B
MTIELILTAAVAAGAGLGVLVLFLLVRWVIDTVRRWREPVEAPLLADHLSAHLAAVAPPRSVGEQLDRRFERMVGRSVLGMNVAQATASMMLTGAVVAVAVYAWQGQESLAIAAGMAAAVGLLGIFAILHWRWRRLVQGQLPDTIHLLARSLRAGLTVDQSVELIGAQGQQPIAGEFKRCSEHLKLGMTVPAALDMTARRIDLPDFDLLVALVSLHRETGGNLALLVDRLAVTVRSRNHFRGHVAAVTALGRITGTCLAAAPPTLFLIYWLLYPDYITRLTRSSQGLAALCTAAALEVIGVVWLSWLLRIEY